MKHATAIVDESSKAAPREDILTVARRIAKSNWEAEPEIEQTYLFPAEDEVRLIHLDSGTPASREGESIAPFYFGSNHSNGVPYLLAVALIRPEEMARLSPPEGWGSWSDAIALKKVA